MRHARPGEAERATGMDPEHLLPILIRQLPQHAVAQDSGVVDQHVHSARLPDRAGHDPGHVAGVTDVGRDVVSPDVGRRPRQFLLVVIDHEHVGGGGLEVPGQFVTDAASGTGHDDRAPAEVIPDIPHHDALPSDHGTCTVARPARNLLTF